MSHTLEFEISHGNFIWYVETYSETVILVFIIVYNPYFRESEKVFAHKLKSSNMSNEISKYVISRKTVLFLFFKAGFRWLCIFLVGCGWLLVVACFSLSNSNHLCPLNTKSTIACLKVFIYFNRYKCQFCLTLRRRYTGTHSFHKNYCFDFWTQCLE